MTLLVVLGCLLAYFVVGLLIGAAALPQTIRFAAAVRDRGTYDDGNCPNGYGAHKGGSKEGDICRRCVKNDQCYLVFLWPALGPAALVRAVADRAVDKIDPAVQRRQQERIRELERQLDIR